MIVVWKYFKLIIGLILWVILFCIGCVLVPIFDLIEVNSSKQPLKTFYDDLMMSDKYIPWSVLTNE